MVSLPDSRKWFALWVVKEVFKGNLRLHGETISIEELRRGLNPLDAAQLFLVMTTDFLPQLLLMQRITGEELAEWTLEHIEGVL